MPNEARARTLPPGFTGVDGMQKNKRVDRVARFMAVFYVGLIAVLLAASAAASWELLTADIPMRWLDSWGVRVVLAGTALGGAVTVACMLLAVLLRDKPPG